MVRTKFKARPKIKGRPPQPEDEEDFEPPSFTEPQEGLVPIGNSPFYLTPGEPADPWDCNRYPDSIYCGENPFTELPVGIEPSIVFDDCNIGIELKPILGFVILPPVQIVYRRPGKECREKVPIKPPPFIESDGYIPFFNLTDQVCLYKVVVEFTAIGFDDQAIKSGISSQIFERPYQTFKERSYTLCWSPVAGMHQVKRLGTDRKEPLSYESLLVGDETRDSLSIDLYARSIKIGLGLVAGGHPEVGLLESDIEYLRAKYAADPDIQEEYEFIVNKYKLEPTHGGVGGASGFSYFGAGGLFAAPTLVSIEEVWCSPDPILELFSPPPPPKLPKRCDCTMTCCPTTTQNDQLLRALIAKVDKLSSIIGVDDYPVSLPTSLISRDEGFIGNLIPNANEEVPTMTQFLAWYIKRFDEIMGQWEIPIEIKDSDPSKPGDQPVGIKLPNMAEAIAEMFTLCFQTNINSETLLNIGIRNLTETGADKQQNFVSYKLLQSLTDYMGFKQKDIKLKMPLLFTLNKTRYDEILKESEIDVAVVEFDEKFGLEADLMKFREAAAILQANYKKKLDPKSDIKAQILKYLLDTYTGSNKVNKNDDDADFDQFLKDVESGFITTPGVSNTTDPYGKPYSQRPRIKDLTKFEPPTGQ